MSIAPELLTALQETSLQNFSEVLAVKEGFSALHSVLRNKLDISKQQIQYPLYRQVVDLALYEHACSRKHQMIRMVKYEFHKCCI